MENKITIEFYTENDIYGAYIGSDSGSGITVENKDKKSMIKVLSDYLIGFIPTSRNDSIKDVIKEFNELRSSIECHEFDNISDEYCTISESDDTKVLDVSDSDYLICSVCVSKDYSTGLCIVSTADVDVKWPDGTEETIDIELLK